MSFENLGLAPSLLSTIHAQGYTEPTPIQKQAIPAIINGEDVIAAAQTGTGKTAGFTLPLLHQLATNKPKSSEIRALILTPTRELAAQVHQSVTTYGKQLPFKACAIFGGVRIIPQIRQLRRRNDIVIATPGRLLDLLNQREINLSHVEHLVLDEADRMLDMGFIDDIKRIIKALPKTRQSLLFSATFSKEIKSLAQTLLNNPTKIEIKRDTLTAETVTQCIHPVDKPRKRALLSYLIGSNHWKKVLVFVRTKHGADRLTMQLEADGLRATAIHGNKTQAARTRALADFKKGKAEVLVATDIAARGLDIDRLPHVVNFDLPTSPEDYVHRIGRTGRAEQSGIALSLVSADEGNLLRNIERLLKSTLPQEIIPGFEPSQAVDSSAKESGSGRRRSRRRPANRNQQNSSRGPQKKRSANGDRKKRFSNRDGKPAAGKSAHARKRRPKQQRQKQQ